MHGSEGVREKEGRREGEREGRKTWLEHRVIPHTGDKLCKNRPRFWLRREGHRAGRAYEQEEHRMALCIRCSATVAQSVRLQE